MFTKTDIEKYFIAEKQESLLFVILGIAAIVIALVGIFYWKTQFWKGASIPLILIAVIQIIVGYTVYARSDKQRTDMVYAFDMDPSKLQNEEIPRMEEVNKNFVTYRWIEIILFVAGIALALVYRTYADKQLIVGIGVALAIEAALMFGADFIAAKRAGNYISGLKTFLQKQKM
jgi:drug/metabolite transporter (DMT)-like permease